MLFAFSLVVRNPLRHPPVAPTVATVCVVTQGIEVGLVAQGSRERLEGLHCVVFPVVEAPIHHRLRVKTALPAPMRAILGTGESFYSSAVSDRRYMY